MVWIFGSCSCRGKSRGRTEVSRKTGKKTNRAKNHIVHLVFLNLCSIQLISIQPPKILIPIKKYVLWYSKIAKKQKKIQLTTKNKTLANPQQPVPPNNWKTLNPVVASASVPTVAASQGQMTPQEDPKVPTVAFLGANLGGWFPLVFWLIGILVRVYCNPYTIG